mgnify:CR=1 FL=1
MLEPRHLLIALLLAGTAGCTGANTENPDRYTEVISQVVETNRQLRAENQNLMEQVAEEERHVRQAAGLINDIMDGLAVIAEQEAEVREVMTNVGADLSDERTDTVDMESIETEIDRYVTAIGRQLRQNRSRLEELRETVRSSNDELAAYEDTIHRLKKLLAEKETLVADLRRDLNHLQARVATLEVEKDTLQRMGEELRSENRLLREAYYVVSTKNDLEEKNIVNKRFLRPTRLEELNPKHFTSIDMTVEQIPLPEQRDDAKVFSIHNRKPHLYEIQDERLVINNPEEFWTVSRYLIVEIDR